MSICLLYTSNEFLTVDVILQEQGKEFKSRNPQEIKNYVNNAKRSKVSLERSKIVLQEVLDIFDSIINEVEIK